MSGNTDCSDETDENTAATERTDNERERVDILRMEGHAGSKGDTV